jgi:hypothetical protein
MDIIQYGTGHTNGESIGCGLRPQSLAVGVLIADPQYVDIIQHRIAYVNGKSVTCRGPVPKCVQ